MKKTHSEPMMNRLEGWARYDPASNDSNNPLLSNEASEYWARHEDCASNVKEIRSHDNAAGLGQYGVQESSEQGQVCELERE